MSDFSLHINPDYCLRERGLDCTACLEICPHKALSVTPGKAPHIDTQCCSACGLCEGICDAFGNSQRTLLDTAARILRITDKNDRAYLSCNEYCPVSEDLPENLVILPCLAATNQEFWLDVLTAKAPVLIACDFEVCQNCEKAGPAALDRFSTLIAQAEKCAETHIGFSENLPLETKLMKQYAQNETLDRRGVFQRLLIDASETASGTRRVKTSSVIQDFYRRKEAFRAQNRLRSQAESPFQNFASSKSIKELMRPRRQLLLEALKRQPELGTRYQVRISTTEAKRCVIENNLCLVGKESDEMAFRIPCVHICPTGARALRMSDKSPTPYIWINPQLCIACDLCTPSCSYSAIGSKLIYARELLNDPPHNETTRNNN